MIRKGSDYIDSIRANRDVYMNGEKVKDITKHPMFKPIIDIRAKIYDMQHDAKFKDIMTVENDGEINAIGNSLPFTQEDWWAKRRATDTVMEEVGGVVTRVGDETVGEMWSLYDGQDVLNEVDPQFSKNISNFISTEIEWKPLNCVLIPKDKSEELVNFFETLDEEDDIQNFYSNAELEQ